MLRTIVAVLTLSLATAASAQNRPAGSEPDFVGDYCTYGGQLYTLGASICVGREVAIKCIRYSSFINELRDLSLPPLHATISNRGASLHSCNVDSEVVGKKDESAWREPSAVTSTSSTPPSSA